MKYKNILVPFDGSEQSFRALREAIELASENGAMIRVVKVIDAKTIDYAIEASGVAGDEGAEVAYPSGRYNIETYKEYIKAGRKWLQDEFEAEVAQAKGSYAGPMEAKLVEGGSPARAIVDFGKEHRCDIIVMGRRGLGSFRGMLGSVSFSVLHGADVPVLTVK